MKKYFSTFCHTAELTLMFITKTTSNSSIGISGG